MAKFLSKDGKFYMREGKLLGYTPPPPKASLTPQNGITYTSGLPSDWNVMKEIAKAISEASDSINANTIAPIYVNNSNIWAYKITPGDTINVTSQMGTYTYAIMGFNNFALTNQGNYGGSHTTAGITLGAVDCIMKDNINLADSNSGSWGGSRIRVTGMSVLKLGMPDTLAQVKVPYVDYDNQSTILYSDDYMFLPSEKEVFGTRTYSPTAETNALTQFAYYKNGGNKIKSLSGTAFYWWLRSVNYNNPERFCCVNTSGYAYDYYASQSYGVAPCFCI